MAIGTKENDLKKFFCKSLAFSALSFFSDLADSVPCKHNGVWYEPGEAEPTAGIVRDANTAAANITELRENGRFLSLKSIVLFRASDDFTSISREMSSHGAATARAPFRFCPTVTS